jgi:hypothetical protein
MLPLERGDALPQKEKMTVQYDVIDRDTKPRRVNDQELPDWEKGPSMGDHLKQLQDEGWMISGKGDDQIYYFER